MCERDGTCYTLAIAFGAGGAVESKSCEWAASERNQSAGTGCAMTRWCVISVLGALCADGQLSFSSTFSVSASVTVTATLAIYASILYSRPAVQTLSIRSLTPS